MNVTKQIVSQTGPSCPCIKHGYMHRCGSISVYYAASAVRTILRRYDGHSEVHSVVYLLRYPLAMLGKGKGGSLPRVCNLNSISTNRTLFIFTCDLAGTAS